MPRKRKYKHGNLAWSALDQDRWSRDFDLSQRIALYRQTDPNTITIIGYYNTVSAANAAAIANESSGVRPKIAINWTHSTITHRTSGGPLIHPDADTDLPSWIDAIPVS